MSRSSTLIVFGLLLMLVPVSGLPSSLRALLTVVFGACVLVVGIMARAEIVRKTKEAKQQSLEQSTESTPPTAPSEISPI